MIRRVPPFWPLQAATVCVFAFFAYPVMLTLMKSFEHTLYGLLILISIGFSLVIGLRYYYHWIRERITSFVVIIFIAIPISCLIGSIWFVIFLSFIRGLDLTLIRLDLKSTLMLGCPILSFAVFTWSASYLGTKYWADLQVEKEHTLAATELATHVQLDMLRYQLNPHFLFNILNSIRAMILEDVDQARMMIAELSEYLRFSLTQSGDSEVKLGEEIKTVQAYLTLEKIRFEDDLDVKVNIDETAKNIPIISYLFHPLVENAVKYGMQTSPMPLKILIIATVENGTIRINVQNSGKWVESSIEKPDSITGTGVGLENIRTRLQQKYPEKHRFNTFEKDGWVHAVIEIDK